MNLFTRQAGRCGFTLIEMMLAITIFAMVAGVIFSSFRAGISSWEKGERDIAFQQDMRAATELIFREISGTHPYKVTPGTLDVHRSFIAFFGRSDSLTFVSTATLQNKTGGLSVLELWVDEQQGLMLGEAPALVASYDELNDINLHDEKYAAVLSPWVKKVAFRYFEREKAGEEGDWQERWDPKNKKMEMPLLVEVTLTFADIRENEIEQKVIVPIMSLKV